MAIKVCLEDVLKERGMTSKELCSLVNITEANLSVLRSGMPRACGSTPLTGSVISCNAMLAIS